MKEYLLWTAKFVTSMVIFVVMICVALPLFFGMLLAGLGSQVAVEKELKEGGKTVAVVELGGMITSSKEVVEALYAQVENSKVKGIVLRIDSPGGAVGPSQEIYTAVKRLKEKKPIVASMGSVAASGGLYSALSATKVYAQPGTVTGSIGVIMQAPNFSEITKKYGVDMVTIKSGKFKDAGNSFRKMTEDERAYLQSTVNDIQDDFVQAVIEGRKLSAEKVKTFADGRIIVGRKAKELGLVDELGGVHDAAAAVFDILGEPLEEGEYPKLYYPEDKIEKLKKIFEAVLDLPAAIRQGGRGRLEALYMTY